MSIQSNIQRLTLGELAVVEDISGVSVTQIADPASPKAKVMIAVAYVLEKRANPQVKLNHIQALTMEEISHLLSPEGDSDDAGEVVEADSKSG